MKKALQLLIFTFVFSSVFGQDIKDSTDKWSIGISGSLNYNRLYYPTNKEITYAFILTPGINLIGKRKISRRFDLEFGVNYFELKTKRTSMVSDLTFGEVINVNRTSFQFLSFPTLVHYNFGKKKLNFSLTAGTEWTFLAHTERSSKKEHYPETITKNPFPKGQFSIYANLGFVLNYQISTKVLLFMQVQYQKNLIPYVYIVEATGPDSKLKREIDFMRLPIGILYKV